MTAGSPRWPIAARTGSPSETAVRTKTSREIPNSTGSSATSRRATSASIGLPIEPDLAQRRHVHLRRAGHRRALEPPDGGLLQEPARVPVDEDPRRLLDDHLLGLPVL